MTTMFAELTRIEGDLQDVSMAALRPSSNTASTYGANSARQANEMGGSPEGHFNPHPSLTGHESSPTLPKRPSRVIHPPGVAQNTTRAVEFEHQEGAVIVTKVHGPHQLALLKQSLCLLDSAYNHRVQYDILVFTTISIEENDPLLLDVREIVAPAKLTVVVDNEGIVNEIYMLSPIRREKFLQRCNATSPEQVTWDTKCFEDGVGISRLSYNWQAEFRSWHIWTHPALERYRYMMWIDTDAFCTQPWNRDPIALAIENRLVLFVLNYPQGRAKAAQPKVKQAFGKYLCSVTKQNGHFVTTLGDDCAGSQLWTIHGMFHVTDLDFYRQEKVLHWAETLIGDCFLCRKFDDQVALTVPPAILAPEQVWDMYKHEVKLNIFHNSKMDGKPKQNVGGFLKYWEKNAKTQFPDGFKKCSITERT
jgi:hypothetical protein